MFWLNNDENMELMPLTKLFLVIFQDFSPRSHRFKASGQRKTGKVDITCIKYLPSGLFHLHQLDVHVSMFKFGGVLNIFFFFFFFNFESKFL